MITRRPRAATESGLQAGSSSRTRFGYDAAHVRLCEPRAEGGRMRRVIAVVLALVGILSLIGAAILGAALWVWLTTMPWVA